MTYHEPCTFSAALERMKAGEKMRRREWAEPGFYWIVLPGIGLTFTGGVSFPRMDNSDILAEDWESAE